MLSGEMNARMSREMETMMDIMLSQISSAISSAISERVIPEIQNMVENLPVGQYGVEPCTSTNEDGIRNVWKNTNTKLTKKDSRSACNLRDHTDSVPYTLNFVFAIQCHQSYSEFSVTPPALFCKGSNLAHLLQSLHNNDQPYKKCETI